ncbi:MAG: hypothetical protein E6G85_12995 [Alphaproteobacteria bacterium]|nr:MAG: hypothetical protein E6G85_12995 [Alphaproteobacteria bacterium]
MAHLLPGGEKCSDLIHDDDYRSPLGAYRFGRTHAKSVRGRTALSRINGYFRNMIEVIADAKLRRMQGELELRAIHYDRPSESWLVHKSDPAEHSR